MGVDYRRKRSICLSFAAVLLILVTITGCATKKVSTTKVSDADFDEMAGTEEGYYFLHSPYGETMIYYFPAGGKEALPLCSKANCTHSCDIPGCQHTDDSLTCGYRNCDAHLTRGNFISQNAGIIYYDGKLYVLMRDSEGIGLYSISTDGTKREKVCTVDENANQNITQFILYKGYLYYEVSDYAKGEYDVKIHKINLNKTAEKELVFEQKGNMVGVNWLRAYENGVFFVLANEKNDDDTLQNVVYELYRITENGAEKIIEREDVSVYTVIDECIYYHSLHDSMLYCYNMNTRLTDALYGTEKDMLYMMWTDSEYIYLDNGMGAQYYMFEDIDIQRVITVLKKDGSFVRDIYLTDMDDVIAPLYVRGSDDKYFILTNLSSWYVYDKSQLETGGNDIIKIWEREDK